MIISIIIIIIYIITIILIQKWSRLEKGARVVFLLTITTQTIITDSVILLQKHAHYIITTKIIKRNHNFSHVAANEQLQK